MFRLSRRAVLAFGSALAAVTLGLSPALPVAASDSATTWHIQAGNLDDSTFTSVAREVTAKSTLGRSSPEGKLPLKVELPAACSIVPARGRADNESAQISLAGGLGASLREQDRILRRGLASRLRSDSDQEWRSIEPQVRSQAAMIEASTVPRGRSR
jgi:hypothetical protein